MYRLLQVVRKDMNHGKTRKNVTDLLILHKGAKNAKEHGHV